MLKRRWSGILAGLSVCAAGSTTQGAGFYLYPVGASGSHTLTAQGITLHGGGQRVFLEIFVAGWAPYRLKAWQAAIDASGYSSGSAGVLSPAYETCASSTECVDAYGTGAICGYTLHNNECTPGFVGFTRPDYVFATVSDISSVDLSTINYRYASTILLSAPITDPGVPKYAGTLVLDVPIDAAGTFTVGFMGEPDSQLLNEGDQFITPLILTATHITIACDPAGCDDGNACTDDGCDAGGQCTHAPNYNEGLFCCYPEDRTLCSRRFGSPGDFNRDGRADLLDFARLQVCFDDEGVLTGACEGVELNCDCALDLSDMPDFTSAMTGP